MNEVIQAGMLREAFESKRLPKNLTEEQFLFLIGECLSEDGNFILEHYKILTHPNPTPEMLNEAMQVGKIIKAIPGIIKGIPGWIDDAWKWGKSAFQWVWKKVGDTWEWVWSGPPGSTPDVPKPTKPGRIPDSCDGNGPNGPPDGPLRTPNGFPTDSQGQPWDDEHYDIDDIVPDVGPIESQNESLSNFNRNMRHLMESNHQIDQNLLHSMLNQVNESTYLLELAIQRNQVNLIIERILPKRLFKKCQ